MEGCQAGALVAGFSSMSCRPYGTRFHHCPSPGTAVPGFYVSPLTGLGSRDSFWVSYRDLPLARGVVAEKCIGPSLGVARFACDSADSG